MFNLTTEDNDTIRVTFSYDFNLNETRCTIFRGSMVDKDIKRKLVKRFEGEVVTEGFAKISDEDLAKKISFNKFLGRKSALKHAMQPVVFNKENKEYELLDIFERPLRTAIWNTYFKLSPKSKF